MNQWPYQIGSYSPAEVQEYCVNDTHWQYFRKLLKGLSTTDKLDKLDKLHWRLQDLKESGYYQRKHDVQTWNYLNALKRGGQLSMDLEVQR